MKKILKIIKNRNKNQLKQENLTTEKDKSQSIQESPDFISNEFELTNRKIFLDSCPEISNDQLSKNLILLVTQLNLLKNEEYTEETEETKNYLIKTIFSILKTHKAFCVYFYNNHIDDSAIMKIIPHLNYEYYEKEKYICKEGDNANEVFFLLKGEISIRKKRINYGSLNEEEIENNKISDNSNIGAWDIVYERKRKLSFYTLTNCHIITLKKDSFKLHIMDKFNRTEMEKQLFLTNFFSTYLNSTSNKIERIIANNLKTLMFKKGEIICKEGNDNKYLYLLFIGEINVVKNLNKTEFYSLRNFHNSIQLLQLKAKDIDYIDLIENIEKAKNNKNKLINLYAIKNPSNLKRLLKKENQNDLSNDENDVSNSDVICTFGKGFLGGLEICSGMTKSNYSLVANKNYTTVFQIDLEKFNESLNGFLIKLIPLFVKYEKQIHSNINKIKFIDHNIIPLNCQKFKKEKISIETVTNNFEENESIFHKRIKKINESLETNEGGFIKFNEFNLKLSKEKNDIKEKLKKSKKMEIEIDDFLKKYDAKNTYLNYSKVKLRNSYVSKSNKSNDFSRKKLNNFYTSRNKIKNKNYTKRIVELFEKLIDKNYLVKHYSDEERKLLLDKHNERIKNLKELNSRNPNQSNFINEIIIFDDSNINNSPREKLFKKNLLKTGYSITEKNDKIDNSKKIYRIINNNYIKELFQNNSANKNNNRNRNSKELELNDKSLRMIYYNTGSYNMPLVTNLKNKNVIK